MSPGDRWQKTAIRAVGLGFLSVLGYFTLRLVTVHMRIITFPYQMEFREGAVPLFTRMLLDGGNPYSLENHPRYTNVYGILYHWVVYPVAHLFGSTLEVHRIVSGVFILASCVLLALVVRRRADGYMAAFSAAVLMYGALLLRNTAIARPDALGVFLFLAALFVPWWFRFGARALAASVILSVAAFLTKPYFLLALPFLAVYLFLFVSKRKAVAYAVAGGIVLVAVSMVINATSEMYFYDTLIIHRAYRSYRLSHVLDQFETLFRWTAPLLAIGTAALLITVRGRAVAAKPLNPFRWSASMWRIDLFRADQPLLGAWLDLPEFCLAASIAVIIYPLGGHMGNTMTYLLQLIMPFLVVVAASWIRTVYRSGGRYRPLFAAGTLVLVLLCAATFEGALMKHSRFEGDYSDWPKLDAMIGHYSNVFNSPAVVSILLQQGKTVYDSGQSQYFRTWQAERLDDLGDLQRRALERDIAYSGDILRGIRQRRFDLVLADEYGASSYVQRKFLENFYEYFGTLTLPMPTGRRWTLTFWRPRSGAAVRPERRR